MLTVYDWIYGVSQLAAMFLALFAAILSLTLFKTSKEFKVLGAWKWMIAVIVLIAVEELLGTLRTFGVWATPHLTHVVPSIILLFLMAALIRQIQINKGWI